MINTQDGRHGGYIWHQIMHIWGIVVYTHIMIQSEQLVITTVIHSLWLEHASKEAYSSSIYLDSGILETAWRSYTYAKYNMHTLHKKKTLKLAGESWLVASFASPSQLSVTYYL